MMNRTKRTLALLLALLICAPQAGTAMACSWAAYNEGEAAIVGRTMDWYEPDSAVAKGHGRGVKVKAAETPNALEYTSKYASIQIHSFGDIVIEAMNEKGLQCSILFLDGSELPYALPDRKDVNVANFPSYVVSNFATVQEVVDSLANINITPVSLSAIPGPGGAALDYKPENTPLHFAMVDATGDKAVIEFVEGRIKLYHGKDFDAMTNEPNYDVHLYLESCGYQPNGSNLPADRRARAKQFLVDMKLRGVKDQKRALFAMRGLVSSVWAGTEQVDQIENEVYPTIWAVLADQKAPSYYLWRYNAWDTQYYDFGAFEKDKPEVVVLKPATPPAL